MNPAELRRKTTLERYSVDNVAQLAEVQQKRQATFAQKRNTILFYQEPRVNELHADDLTLMKLKIDFAHNWLNEYHPFKAPRGTVLALGLCDNDNIYCIMTFKKSRNKQYYSELSRLWTLPTYYVIDGYQRLSHHASELGVWNIVAYVNRSFENVNDYLSIGMRYVRSIQRTKWWVSNSEIVSDASRRQKHLSQEDMISYGFTPMYDDGVDVLCV